MSQNDQTAPKQNKAKKKFTPLEDAKIVLLVSQLGEHCWKKIAEFLDDRTARQCRERWKHYLNKIPVKNEWTKTEDETLLYLYNEYGPKWTKIAEHFNGRTSVNVKNRFALLERHKKKEEALKLNTKFDFTSEIAGIYADYFDADSVENMFM